VTDVAPSASEGLGAYGDAVDLAARVPTLMGVVLATIAAAFVSVWTPARIIV
jgi:hypothetical protein